LNAANSDSIEFVTKVILLYVKLQDDWLWGD